MENAVKRIGVLTSGGDAGGFYFNEAGRNWLLEVMLALGWVVDQISEFKIFCFFPTLSVSTDVEYSFFHHAFCIDCLRCVGKSLEFT